MIQYEFTFDPLPENVSIRSIEATLPIHEGRDTARSVHAARRARSIPAGGPCRRPMIRREFAWGKRKQALSGGCHAIRTSFLVVGRPVLWGTHRGVLAPGGASRCRSAAPKAPKSKKRSNAGQQELYGLSWHESVDGALRDAAAGSPEKPVFWLRMLGDLGGYS